MDQLPLGLTQLPNNALDVLRYMGQAHLERADSDTLAQGTGMSERAVMRAIRGLVTKGYLNMDDSYIYFLTDKGMNAIDDVMAFDAANPSEAADSSTSETVTHHLIAVAPSPMGAQETTTLKIGLDAIPPVSDHSQLVLRLSSSAGKISPPEVTIDLYPNQMPEVGETYFTPDGHNRAIRIRVQAMQLVNMMNVHEAGGMFFDLPLAPKRGNLQAWYGQVELQS